MGLMDRGYMKDRAGARPFSPPRERSLAGTLLLMCALLTGVFVLYKSADRYLLQRAAERKAQTDTHELKAMPTPARPGPAPAAASGRSQPPYPSTTAYAAPPNTHGTVTKCVTNGQTSYGDASTCAVGAKASQLTTRSDHNLMNAVPVPADWADGVDAPSVVVVQNNSRGARNKPNEARCKALSEAIAQLDAQARQALSRQHQDQLRAQRKEWRDEQFRVPCR